MYRLIRAALVLGIAFLLCPVAHAQMFRAYLASYGSDSNPCTVGAPCRLLPAALNAVATNGEIWILDSANFNAGTVTITKNVSIQAIPGQVGSFVAVAGGPALVIASAASVALRNLTVATNASNPGTDGIQAKGGSYVTVENLVFEVRNASNYVAGIRVTESGTRIPPT